mmetsp:Transcript_30444/g.55204  ORF Transcript_30444/g.55204 Transcript_30444/m.55204 type:complete len:91 (+) Transcript_30444:1374-1646(+)
MYCENNMPAARMLSRRSKARGVTSVGNVVSNAYAMRVMQSPTDKECPKNRLAKLFGRLNAFDNSDSGSVSLVQFKRTLSVAANLMASTSA